MRSRMELLKRSNLYVVMFDNPLASFDDQDARDFFSRIIKLKRDGFDTLNSKYLAIDTTDFVGTHLLICHKESRYLEPLLCTKAITKSRCDEFSLPFSGFECISKTKSSPHIEGLKIFLESIGDATKMSYTSSFTISPKIKDRHDRDFLLKLFLPLVAQYHQEYSVPYSFCIGRVRTHADQIIRGIGYEGLKLKGKKLPPASFPQYLDDEFDVLTFERPSDESLFILSQNKDIWDRRIILKGDSAHNQLYSYTDDHHHEHKRAS